MARTTLRAVPKSEQARHEDTSKHIGQVRADHLTDALSFRSGLRPDPDIKLVRELAELPEGTPSE